MEIHVPPDLDRLLELIGNCCGSAAANWLALCIFICRCCSLWSDVPRVPLFDCECASVLHVGIPPPAVSRWRHWLKERGSFVSGCPCFQATSEFPIRRARLAFSMTCPTQLALWLAHLSQCHLFFLRCGCGSLLRCGQGCLGILHSQVLIVGVHLLGRFCHSARSSGLARALHMTPIFSPQPWLLQIFQSLSGESRLRLGSRAASLLLQTLRMA